MLFKILVPLNTLIRDTIRVGLSLGGKYEQTNKSGSVAKRIEIKKARGIKSFW